ncbi:hypothetical protein GT037_007227 [Alternaria burnsii]|uniref:Uncharacterized protein n=1 Tax=Alternaria burnsii TaxID=1187904 RepID=A0A8H7B3S8_9PLEO|nr:uncharacterized protein GT037_007227 [Alternaria burnsii]KAF7674467.1 hypothetical protein GT037_007227 [Alternaria burnsii]
MVTKPNNITCCGDSGLSVAANVIGILTFVLGAVLTYFAYLSLSFKALKDIQMIREDHQRWCFEMDTITLHCQKQHGQENPTFSRYTRQLQAGLDRFNRVSEFMEHDLNSLPEFDTQNETPHIFQIRRRVLWAFRRQKAVEHYDQLFKIKSEVHSMFVSYTTERILDGKV